MDTRCHHLWRLGCVVSVQGLTMQTEQLRRKARQLYNNSLVPQQVNQYNQRKWVRSVLKLGDKWLVAKSIERIQ
jgi:hypothetical protein